MLVGAVVVALLGGWYAFAFTPPVDSPPTCNAGDPGCDAPINVGGTLQHKQGTLQVDNFRSYLDGIFDGNVGIGIPLPLEKLEVDGNIRLGGALPSHKISNLATPIASSDAATKGYVDAASGGGGAYTAYGTTSCASGWTTAYTGVAMSTVISTGSGAGTGGIVCKNGSAFTDATSGGFLWVTGSSGVNASPNPVSCAVCVK